VRFGNRAGRAVSVLSDDRPTLLSLARAAADERVTCILDWWHISIRVRHIQQALCGIDTFQPRRRTGLEIVEWRIGQLRHLFWKGYNREALQSSSHEGRGTMTMNRREFSAAMLAGAAASLVSADAAAAPAAPMTARNVVLVHGLFADGSCWSEVIPRLQAKGLNVTSVQNPLSTLPEAVASARRVLDRQDGPTVFVGHSFSGMILTEAGVHKNVFALVYVAARAPDAGEDYAALAKRFPTPPASAGIVFDGDEGRLTEAAFLRDFAGDLPETKAKVLYAVQEPFQKTLLAGKTTHAAWRSKPSYYAVSTEDRTINPDLERFMAKRMSAKTIEVKASHLSLISHPDEISELVLEAAGHSG
jgi:pimeloyl-ACP methyl ester carboxylesterase